MVDAREHAAIKLRGPRSARSSPGWATSSRSRSCASRATSRRHPSRARHPTSPIPAGASGPLAQKLSGTFKTDVEIPGPAGKEKATKVGVALKVDCEKVEVEVSQKVAGTGDLLSVFGKGEADLKKDTVTLVAGVKGSVAGLARASREST